MLSRRENRCRRFQANVFNKSKCQNCFKPVDSHTLSESDGTKPVKAGWLLLAPEGINFISPAHKKRKWQRRFFTLYEHGLLCYALDEMAGTLPQGSVNMLQCCEVLNVSAQTGFPNSLQLCCSDRDYYIRTETGDNITGWQDNLMVYMNAAKSSQRKRRRGHTHTPVAPDRGPMSSSSNGSPCSSRKSCYVGCSTESSKSTDSNRVGSPPPSSLRAGLQEDEAGFVWRGGVIPSSTSPSTSSVSSCLSSPLREPLTGPSTRDGRGGFESGYSSLENMRSDEDLQTGFCPHYRCEVTLGSLFTGHPAPPLSDSRSKSSGRHRGTSEDVPRDVDPPRTHSPGGEEVRRLFGKQRKRSLLMGQFAKENEVYSSPLSSSSEHGCEKRANHSMVQEAASTSQRSKSLERRLTNPTPTTDLLNFKKGWMTRLGEDGMWKKHWFVLTDQSLKFYRDAVAEEAADSDGEIDLSSCYEITDFPVQKNYGFQIHTKDGVFTLCAMTYGIRRNWIQAVMNSVRTTIPPDLICSVPQNRRSGPGVKSPSPLDACQSEEEKWSRIAKWRKEGRYKTFDWAEFSHRQLKRKEFSRQAAKGSEPIHREIVPPAPEEPIAILIREVQVQSEKTCLQKDSLQAHCVTQDAGPPNSSSVIMATSSRVPPDSSGEERQVACGDCFHDVYNAQVKPSSMPLLGSLCSSSAQTEWQWEEELQSICNNLKAELERSGREFRVSEARLQAELQNSQDRLREAESRLQQSEASLQERVDMLEEVRRCLEEAKGRLKATQETQAVKDVRLQRQMRLLQESQELERRSLGDSLDQSERRVLELEERLQQTEAALRDTSVSVADLRRTSEELRVQLDESERERGRLQLRLRGEETQYYDMEHDYERVCEELQCVRGALQDCERSWEERLSTRLDQQQRELDRKERQLQELTLKMAALGLGTMETEVRLKEGHAEPHGLLGSTDDGEKMGPSMPGDSETQTGTREDSQRVISVIHALETKQCHTEEKLWEITLRLQQQDLQDEEGASARENSLWDTLTPATSPTPATPPGAYPSQRSSEEKSSQALCGLLGVPLESTAANAEVLLENDGESPARRGALGVTPRLLALEALVIQKMASALEHPSRELIQRLSDMQVQAQHLGEVQRGTLEGRTLEKLSLFSTALLQEAADTLGEHDIYSLCVRAELAYHTYTLCAAAQALPGASGDMEPRPADQALQHDQLGVGPQAELRTSDPGLEGTGRESLVAELRAQAQTLQSLSLHLQPEPKHVDVPAELPPPALQMALFRATLTYVTSRARMALQQEECSRQARRNRAMCECSAERSRSDALFYKQAQSYEEKLRESQQAIERAELGLVSAEANAQMKDREVQRLEVEFNEKIHGLQQIHEEEMERLHCYYSKSAEQEVTTSEFSRAGGDVPVAGSTEQTGDDKPSQEECDCSEVNSLRLAYEQKLETLKATCELGFSSMEQNHQRVIKEVQRQHQMEVERLREEQERALQEEADATIAAIEAIYRAHKEELERCQMAQKSGATPHLSQQHHGEELEDLHRELEVLSQQYSQKCLENAHLRRAVETERETLISTVREIQDLRTHNQSLCTCTEQEVSMRVLADLSLVQPYVVGGMGPTRCSEGRDVHQLEVIVRVKESEIQCLKQEIKSLKEELQSAHKKLLNELSNRAAPSQPRSNRPDLMKSRSNPELVKDQFTLVKDQSKRKLMTRSKSLMDGVSVQERMKLFQSDDSRKM
ncbi:uncharacterized protein LOC143503217 isoform X2 [Brachyhypopomus gauderio]|uniref:uncharacterized protein LOC143503217 isoform X2 n=1 Tax=Brachyhypopomus gauderio TaxID=698409 RepID=UPI00404199BF